MSRREQQIGRAGERAAEMQLRAMGVDCLEPVGKHVSLTPVDAKLGVYRVRFISKLSGDLRGLLNGRSVLVEVKTITDRDTLRWSDLRKGQPESLTEHHEAGGLSLFVWVHDDVYVLEWPVPGFAPRKSVKLEWAKRNGWKF